MPDATPLPLRYLAAFGLMPYSRSVRLLKLQKIYTVILLLTTIYITWHGIIRTPIKNDNLLYGDMPIPNFMGVTLFITFQSTLALTLLDTMLTYEQYFQYLDKSQQLQRLFCRQLHFPVSRESQRLKYALYALVAYGLFAVQCTIVALHYYYGCMWHLLAAELILRTRCLQSLWLLDCLIFYMQMLNARLQALVSCKVRKQRHFLDVDYNKLESLEYLVQLKNVYSEIYEFARLYNGCFRWSLLPVFCWELTNNCYWMCLVWTNLYAFYFTYLALSVALPSFFLTFLICYTSERCEQEWRLCAVLVNKLVFTTSTDYDIRIYNDLVDDFLLVTMQCPVRIEAHGFLAINLRLLMKILTIMAMILMILMQFCVAKSQFKPS